MANNNKPKQYYWFTMVLYPDNRSHLAFVEKVLPNLPLRVIGILHNNDYVLDDELLLQIFNSPDDMSTTDVTFNQELEIKKAHLHLVLKLPQKRTLKGMQDIISAYGVETRFIRPCDPYHMCSYLTHKNAPHKYQYSDDEVFGDIGLYTEYSTYSGNHEFNKFYQLMINIDEEVGKGNLDVSYSSFCYYVFTNGLGHLLTGKGNFMYNTIIKEKIKEIKNYGLHYTVPHYGKIDI